MAATTIKQRRCVTLMWLATLFKCHFDVVAQYFEEILFDLKERKELIKHIEYIK